MKREYRSVELDKETARKLKRFLRLHEIHFETSECGDLIHFQILCDDNEETIANDYLGGRISLTFFTFGTDEKFPYRDCYIVIEGDSGKDCINTFRKFFPDRTAHTINCAFLYSESEWDKTGMESHYGNPRLFLSSITQEWNTNYNYAY